MRKANKSKLLQPLDIDIDPPPHIEINPGKTCFTKDTMALIRMANSFKVKTFQELTESLKRL